MALTKEQLEKRSKYIGSSDVYDILSGNGYRVWAEKTGKLEPEKETDAMVRGQLLEPAIINFAALTLGPIITEPNELEFTVNDLHILDHPDGIVDRTGYPLDAKSQGAYAKEVWGDEHTDEVPDRCIVQAQVHMIAMGKDFCHVPAYLAYREFQMFGVPFNAKIAGVISEAVKHFWDNHVVRDEPPDNAETPSLSVLKRIRREPDSCVEISDVTVDAWLQAAEARKKAAAFEERCKAILIQLLGTAEAGKTPSGQLVTYYEQKTGGLLTKELRQAHPDIAAQFANPGTHRVLRLKKV